MPDSKALEIVMRQIAEAARAGDFSKVEEGVIIARALRSTVTPSNSKVDLLPAQPTQQGPTGPDVRATDAIRQEPTGSQHASRQVALPNGASQRRDAREHGKLARQCLFSALSGDGIPINHVRNREYRTAKGKRVVVPFATEDPRGDLWWTGFEDKQYDVVIFLCRTLDGKLLDFVVPWSFIAPRWADFSRSGGQVEFHVRRNTSGYVLDVPHGVSLTITPFLSESSPLR